jgi:hypothetical protein
MTPTESGSESESNQLQMIHRLPPAEVVDRIDYVLGRCRGRRVVHVGFADAGFRDMQHRTDSWLHGRIDTVAESLIGIDIEAEGVAEANRLGFEAYQADCRDHAAVAALGLGAADVVVAGEVIEHLDDPGEFLSGLHALAGPATELVVTTPNASGLVNTVASLGGREINHPDHVVTYTWRTLTTLMSRHGWRVNESATYTAVLKPPQEMGWSERAMYGAGRVVLGAEKVLGKLGAPFAADGLIVVANPT